MGQAPQQPQEMEQQQEIIENGIEPGADEAELQYNQLCNRHLLIANIIKKEGKKLDSLEQVLNDQVGVNHEQAAMDEINQQFDPNQEQILQQQLDS